MSGRSGGERDRKRERKGGVDEPGGGGATGGGWKEGGKGDSPRTLGSH